MKKIILLLLLISLNSNCQSIIPDGKNLGLVSYLTYVKAISEAKMTTLMTDERYKSKPEKAQKFNSDYNILKLLVDQLVNQISVDMIEKNKIKTYRNLNKFIKGKKKLPEKFTQYSVLIEQIDGLLEAFLMRKYNDGGPLAGASIEEITGIVTEIREITTSARDFREKKVQSINTILKELKLNSISELNKPKEKDSKE